ncbi:glycoside hydrolase family 3 N-terminal domain-containing protein [Hymenobacter tenuis]
MKHFAATLLGWALPAVTLVTGAQAQAPAPQLGKASIQDVLKALTLEEKAHLVVGMGMDFGNSAPKTDGPVAGRAVSKVPGAAGTTFAIPRLGIPTLILADGPAGVRIDSVRAGSTKRYYATAFPVGTSLASTWDTTLVRRVGLAMGNEVREYGVDVLLAPALNIQRNPLGGRNFEYYSEDPRVTGHIAAAMVRGIQANGVGTSIKHFAVNNQETNRSQVDAQVSERALREIYLKGFEIAVKQAQPWTVMSSYNKVNGTYTSESKDLLTTILRDEWGFKGLVMTDWFGGKDPIAQMKAGNDLLMPGPNQVKKIVAAVTAGTLEEQVLDRNVTRVLNLILQSPSFRRYQASEAPDLKAHAQVVREAAAEGMVLLKNNGQALPLTGGVRIAGFGNTTYEFIAGGGGSGEVNKAYTVSLQQGLQQGAFRLDEGLAQAYGQYITTSKAARPPRKSIIEYVKALDEMPISDAQLAAATTADVALLTIGRTANEGNDRQVDRDYYLNANEKSLIQRVSTAFHAKGKKVVVILNIDGVIEVASWRDQVDGILLAWQPGMEAGNAVADVLSGKVNPSGKLAVSFPVDYKDVSSAKNFPGLPATRPDHVTHEEGIYVGYRYHQTFGVKPAYEFGFGQSYTTFTYGKVQLSDKKFSKQLTATVKITNNGKVAGKEVAQLYLSAPGKTMPKPTSELKAFAKTQLLQPGQSQTLTFSLGAGELASFDPTRSAWVAEPGIYRVRIGASSTDLKQTGSFEVAKELMAEQAHRAVMPTRAIAELVK